MIPYGKQALEQDDIDAVVEVLKSPFLTQGPKAKEFEEALCSYTGASYVSVVNSATSALHLAYRSLGVGEGDVVWTSPITFVATANMAIVCGAEVDFVDIDSSTLNMCPLKLEEKLREAKRRNALPKVIVPVHMGGQSCEMEKIFKLSKEYGFKIIEDASHAIGGSYKKNKVGACQYSDACVFSFHPVKIITSAEGGALLTNNDSIEERAKLLRSHGVTKDPEKLEKKTEGAWYYEQQDIGFNYRMTDIQAALGISQLGKIDEFVKQRNELAQSYENLLPGWISTQRNVEDVYSSYHLYIVKVENDIRRKFYEFLRENKIGVQVHYFPVHLQPFYRDKGFSEGDCPVAENEYEKILSIPIFPSLSQNDFQRVVNIINDFNS